jgi:hypothetical protein
MRFVLIKKFCEMSGYTDKAVRCKIQTGVWIERQHWRRAPDGHILIDVEAIEKWQEGKPAASAMG